MKESIKHVAWRDGRPRFSPGRSLRTAGYKGRDLKHEDGRWFTLGEALDWSLAFSQELRPNVSVKPSPHRHVTQPYIYFLWAGNAIKIGFSVRPWKRIEALLVGNGEPVHMFLTIPGTPQDEKRLHRRLVAQRTRGEWFKANETTIAVMWSMLEESTNRATNHYPVA